MAQQSLAESLSLEEQQAALNELFELRNLAALHKIAAPEQAVLEAKFVNASPAGVATLSGASNEDKEWEKEDPANLDDEGVAPMETGEAAAAAAEETVEEKSEYGESVETETTVTGGATPRAPATPSEVAAVAPALKRSLAQDPLLPDGDGKRPMGLFSSASIIFKNPQSVTYAPPGL